MAWLQSHHPEERQRAAIAKILSQALKALRIQGLDQAAEEHPPEYDPQSNGSVEATVKAVKGKSRTVLHCLERRLQSKIPPTHPILTWMMAHVGDSLTRRTRGDDGQTPYQLVRGRPLNTRMLEFG